jgi:hypothetical protein
LTGDGKKAVMRHMDLLPALKSIFSLTELKSVNYLSATSRNLLCSSRAANFAPSLIFLQFSAQVIATIEHGAKSGAAASKVVGGVNRPIASMFRRLRH